MSQIVRAGFAVLFALALSGCFKSDYPLITVFDSVAPIPEGTYTYVDIDKKTKRTVITNSLNVTKMITFDDKGNPIIHNLLMRAVGDGDYIVMDGENDYTLISIKNGAVYESDARDYCDDLQELVELGGESLSDYDAQAIGADSSSICKFASFDGLARAFQALDPDGSLRLARVYRPQ